MHLTNHDSSEVVVAVIIYLDLCIGENAYIYIYFRKNKAYASWKLYETSITVNRGSHFQVHFVWQVWDGQLSPSFKSIIYKYLY